MIYVLAALTLFLAGLSFYFHRRLTAIEFDAATLRTISYIHENTLISLLHKVDQHNVGHANPLERFVA